MPKKRTENMEITEEIKEILTPPITITEDDEKIKLQIIERVLAVAKELQDLDDYFNKLPQRQSQVDEEISDLLHYIEDNDLTPKQSSKMIKLLKEKRDERRNIKNDFVIKEIYNTHKQKLTLDSQRQFFVTEIYKGNKRIGCPYNNRQLGDEEIKKLIT